MTLIEVKNLYKSYSMDSQPVEVLRGVQMEILEGEAMAILGASGAGKSTLLHILGTLDQPTAGTVHFLGKDLFRLTERERSEFRNRTMGFVFQFHHLLPMLTALENTMLPKLISGSSKRAAQEAARDWLVQVGLEGRMEHRPAELSGGEQQRVAIARALIMDPRVLFADEPTGNLDSHAGLQIANLLMELNQERGKTLVAVTHNEGFAARFPRRIRMSDGRLIAQ